MDDWRSLTNIVLEIYFGLSSTYISKSCTTATPPFSTAVSGLYMIPTCMAEMRLIWATFKTGPCEIIIDLIDWYLHVIVGTNDSVCNCMQWYRDGIDSEYYNLGMRIITICYYTYIHTYIRARHEFHLSWGRFSLSFEYVTVTVQILKRFIWFIIISYMYSPNTIINLHLATQACRALLITRWIDKQESSSPI